MLLFPPACRAAAALSCLAASVAQGKVADAPFDRTREFARGDASLRYCDGEGSNSATGSFHLQSY